MILELRMLPILLSLLCLPFINGDMADTDQHDTSSDTSSTGDVDMELDMHEPNLHNPMPDQGYGVRGGNPQFNTPSTQSPPTNQPTPKTTPPPTHGQQSVLAVIQFGIIVGVCLMVGAGFMSMVGLEILCDKACDKYREFTKKPKPLPDIERLHPAELVGTFSRYK